MVGCFQHVEKINRFAKCDFVKRQVAKNVGFRNNVKAAALINIITNPVFKYVLHHPTVEVFKNWYLNN